MKTPESWALEISMASGMSLSNRQFNKIADVIRLAESPEKKAREILQGGKKFVKRIVDD